MKIKSITQLKLTQIYLINYHRFRDERGYFSETYNQNDFINLSNTISSLSQFSIIQTNESYSKKGVIRGLHFQWNPIMGKLVRPLSGHLIDIVLDVRLNSPTFGKAILCDLPVNTDNTEATMIWIPPGFAHGVLFPEDSLIEYACTGTYNPAGEVGINPFDPAIDWSLADTRLLEVFKQASVSGIVSPKDKAGIALSEWKSNSNASIFNTL